MGIYLSHGMLTYGIFGTTDQKSRNLPALLTRSQAYLHQPSAHVVIARINLPEISLDRRSMDLA